VSSFFKNKELLVGVVELLLLLVGVVELLLLPVCWGVELLIPVGLAKGGLVPHS